MLKQMWPMLKPSELLLRFWDLMKVQQSVKLQKKFMQMHLYLMSTPGVLQILGQSVMPEWILVTSNGIGSIQRQLLLMTRVKFS
jgi:hypothetical protein